jgi:hypothetical protein
MAVNIFPIPSSGGGSSVSKFAFTIASNRAIVKQSFAAGIYTFTVPSGTYNVAFYAVDGTLVKQESYMSAVTTIAFSLPSAADRLVFTSSVNGGATADYTPSATTISAQLITTTQSVTLTKSAKVFLIGGGSAGSYGPGGSSGYFAHGSVAAGSYTATVGAGGVGGGGQVGSSSTFSTLTAAGGTVSAGGSGGGAAGNNQGLPGGGGASNGGSSGGTGSGVQIHGFVPGAGGSGGNSGTGGGTYAGGGGGKPAYSGASAGQGFGGGGGGGENGGRNGADGAILIIEDF